MKGGGEAGFPGRRRLVTVLLLVITGGLLWRAVDLQHTDKDFLIGQGDARHLRVEAAFKVCPPDEGLAEIRR